MSKYDHKKIENKWQRVWEKDRVFESKEDKNKKKFYGLIEFPYPSGDGLHTGHLRSNTAMDVICRKRRMQGYNVLYPIGFDAFGLPAENYAVSKGIQPQISITKNIKTFTKQLKESGFSFDWSRSFSTTDKDYYKWTQWIFIQMFKKGLAYKAKENINWCIKCKIGLANEEVVDGKCERCGGEVVKKDKKQWILRITKYADRLIKDLDKVDYLERIKTQQINWIGKSEGADVDFKIKGSQQKLRVFTTRPDTLFGATFMVVAPEHLVIEELKSKIKNLKEVEKYVKKSKKKSDLERADLNKEKTGIELEGLKAVNPVNSQEIPIWVADYVMMGYGTGAIMAVPAHDQRDWEFANKYGLEIIEVIKGGNIKKEAFVNIDSGEMVNSGEFNKMKVKECIKKITKWLEDKKLGNQAVNYKLHDWIFSRQRYWGEPIPMVYCKKCAGSKEQVLILHGWEDSSQSTFIPGLKKNLETKGYDVFAFNAPNTNKPNFNSWYSFIKEKIKENKLENFHLVGHSMGGHLAAKLSEEYKIKSLNLVAPVGFNPRDKYFEQFKNELTKQEIDIFKKYQNRDLDIKKVKKNTDKINIIFGAKDTWITDEIRKFYIDNFKDVASVEILDNCAHWGNDEGIKEVKEVEDLFKENIADNDWVPVAEKDLPVVLPDVEDFMPTDEGESPLVKVKDWVKTKCPKCGGEAKRETDVMPNWAGSNWYFLRYCDPKNNKALASKDKLEYWTPVDWYNGGMEHTTLHLLYSRFIYKFLYDIGAVPKKCGPEPYKKRTAQGMILGKGGIKMSKSKGNVINPDKYIEKYGADTVRMYEMFMGSFDQAIAWDDKSVVGVYRFLNRVWELQSKIGKKPEANKDIKRVLHQTIKKVGEDIENMRFNTAVSQMMIFVNQVDKLDKISQDLFEKFILVISPFSPHLAEELWQALGHKESIVYQKWPEYDKNLIQADEIELVIQINGKVRDKIKVAADIAEKEASQLAVKSQKIQKWLAGKKPKKIIFIKGRLINIVA